MIELAKLFPRRPLVLSIAAWLLIFVLQVVFLTIVAYERYEPPEEPHHWDRVWFVYTELPRVLPMAAVYAVCAVFAAQMIGRFFAKGNPNNPTIGQLRRSLKESPVRALKQIGISSLLWLTLAGLVAGQWVPLPFWANLGLMGLAGGLLGVLFFSSWVDWVASAVTAEEGEETHKG